MPKTTCWKEDKEFTDFIETWGEFVPLDEVMKWIAERYEPGDVFPIGALSRWAEDHGFCERRK